MTSSSATTPEPVIVVCLRHADLHVDVDPLSGDITRTSGGPGLSNTDAAALEHALRLAPEWSATVLAVSAGGPAADETLRVAAALGADVLRVPWPAGGHGAHGHAAAGHGAGDTHPASAAPVAGPTAGAYVTDLAADEHDLARTIVAGVRSVTGGRPVRLVLCGDRSTDRGTGVLPAYLAHEFGVAQALGLVALQVTGTAEAGIPAGPGISGDLIGERRLDAGRREVLRIPVGAVCSVEAAGVRLRRASLPGTLAAARTAVPVAGAPAPTLASSGAEIGRAQAARPRTRLVPPPPGDNPRDRLRALTGVLLEHDPPVLVGPVDAAKAVDVLLEFLTTHGYLDATGTAAS